MGLMIRVKKHIQQELHKGRSVASSTEGEVLCLLPNELKRKLLFEGRGLRLTTGVFFHCWCFCHQDSFAQLCCAAVKLQHFGPDDVVFFLGEVCHTMFLVHSGNFLYYSCRSAFNLCTRAFGLCRLSNER